MNRSPVSAPAMRRKLFFPGVEIARQERRSLEYAITDCSTGSSDPSTGSTGRISPTAYAPVAPPPHAIQIRGLEAGDVWKKIGLGGLLPGPVGIASQRRKVVVVWVESVGVHQVEPADCQQILFANPSAEDRGAAQYRRTVARHRQAIHRAATPLRPFQPRILSRRTNREHAGRARTVDRLQGKIGTRGNRRPQHAIKPSDGTHAPNHIHVVGRRAPDRRGLNSRNRLDGELRA